MKSDRLTRETILSIGVEDRGFPTFKAGDAIKVAEKIKEGNRERIQYFEGDVIAIHNNGVASTFTIRRIAANGIAVEKIFPYYSPKIEGIEFVHEGDVRRAKLYYMRDRIGKKARVKAKVRTHEEKEKIREKAKKEKAEKAKLKAAEEKELEKKKAKEKKVKVEKPVEAKPEEKKEEAKTEVKTEKKAESVSAKATPDASKDAKEIKVEEKVETEKSPKKEAKAEVKETKPSEEKGKEKKIDKKE